MKETTSVKVRIHSVEIVHFKSIERGTIHFGKEDYFLQEDDQVLVHDVIGLFGPNGSGKSAAIEACSVVRYLMATGCLPASAELCIKKPRSDCQIITKFLVQGSDKDYIVEYRLTLVYEEYFSTSPDQPVLAGEMIKARSWNPETQKFGKNLLLGQSVYGSVHDNLAFQARTGRALEQSSGHNMLQSCFFGLEAGKIISESTPPGNTELKAMKLDLLKEILPMLTEFAQKQWLIFMQHDFDESLFFPGCGLSFMAGRGGRIDEKDIARNMDKEIDASAWRHKTYVLPEEDYKKLLETMEKINLVLNTLFPEVQVQIWQERKSLDINDGAVIEFDAKVQRGEELIPLKNESRGMQRLLHMIDGIIQAVNNPYVCAMIDDIDMGIFEYLLGEFIQVIAQIAKGQILFTANNLHILERVDRKNIFIIIENGINNQFVCLPRIKDMTNLRDTYYRCLVILADSEKYMPAIKQSKIRRAFRRAYDGDLENSAEVAEENPEEKTKMAVSTEEA